MLSKWTPGQHWHRHFVKHHPELKLVKFCHLDSKCGQIFNCSMITHYFELQKSLEDKWDGISPEHHWNMDEKGVQMGGGWKNDG